MSKHSFDTVYFCYNFIEKYFLRDYQVALKLIRLHLNLKKNQNVVDVGGGTGFIANSIINKVDSVTVVDLSKQMLMRSKSPIITTIQGNGSSIPFKDGVFDIALLINVLHHMKKTEQDNVLKETFRVLKNQGEAFIMDLFFPKGFFNSIFKKFEEIAVGKTYHLPHNEVMAKLKNIGFHDISLAFPDERHWRYLVIAKKTNKNNNVKKLHPSNKTGKK
ncbi:MAG: class I SAM-dependent methyltransferase [Thermoplasmatales archaeon]|nr:MAG: class I SAM-dependent methyltransferase [Thermoplasmatales archaeon]